MPTPEYADLVSAVAETIEQVLTADPMILPDHDQSNDDTPAFGPAPAHAYVLDFEKIIWHYPDAPSRLIEE
jgi:hypothetical protein